MECYIDNKGQAVPMPDLDKFFRNWGKEGDIRDEMVRMAETLAEFEPAKRWYDLHEKKFNVIECFESTVRSLEARKRYVNQDVYKPEAFDFIIKALKKRINKEKRLLKKKEKEAIS